MIRKANHIIIYSIIASVLFGVIDVLIDTYVLHHGPFLYTLFLDPDEMIFRLFFTAGFVLFGVLISRMFKAKIDAENRLLQSREQYSSLVNSVDDSIYLVDKNCNYLFVNIRHCERMGISQDDYAGTSYSDLHSREETEFFNDIVRKIFSKDEPIEHEYKSGKNGHCYLQTLSPVKDSLGNVAAVTVISKDISERKAMEEKLRTLSFTDELTGLLNRRGFFMLAEKLLTMAQREQKGIFLISADLDNLKSVNDTFGHGAGDEVLVEISMILKRCYRESDIIARIGGDEFVILIKESVEKNMDELARRLKSNLDVRNESTTKPFTLSISIGITRYDPEQPRRLNELLSSADTLMYEMKRKRNPACK